MLARFVTLAGVIAASSLVGDVVEAAENECYLLTSRTSPKGIEKNFIKDDKTPYAAKKVSSLLHRVHPCASKVVAAALFSNACLQLVFLAIFVARLSLHFLLHSFLLTSHCPPTPPQCIHYFSQPFPSLTQCYKFNTKACCVSGHDAAISEAYGNMLSPTCIREFAELEYYMCLGCNHNQPDYVVVDANTNKMTVNICEKFADKLWTSNPRMYDSCGLKINPSGSGFSGDADFILPSRYYHNASEFLNDVKPPYFSSFDINIVPSDDDTKCLDSSATRLGASLLLALVISLINMM